MDDIKTLLGEAFTPELEAALNSTFIPKANAQGEAARLKSELETAKKKAADLELAQLTESERHQKAAEAAIAEAERTKAESLRMMSKLEIQTGLSASGLDLSQYSETIDMLVGDSPESAKSLADGLRRMLDAAALAGETRANETHLKNNGVPAGGSSGAVTREAFDKMTYTEQANLARDNPTLYKQLTE